MKNRPMEANTAYWKSLEQTLTAANLAFCQGLGVLDSFMQPLSQATRRGEWYPLRRQIDANALYQGYFFTNDVLMHLTFQPA